MAKDRKSRPASDKRSHGGVVKGSRLDRGQSLSLNPSAKWELKGNASRTVAEKIVMIRNGVTKKMLSEVKSELSLDYDELSGMLSASRSTLIKKKDSERFDAQISEKVVLLSDLIDYGQQTFGDINRFNAWLRDPSTALGGVTPLSMLDTLYGIDEIKKEIGRIEYGVY